VFITIYDDFLIWLTLYDSNFACRKIFLQQLLCTEDIQAVLRGLCPRVGGFCPGGLCPVPLNRTATSSLEQSTAVSTQPRQHIRPFSPLALAMIIINHRKFDVVAKQRSSHLLAVQKHPLLSRGMFCIACHRQSGMGRVIRGMPYE